MLSITQGAGKPRSLGAGEGNRTLVVCLGSFCSTIELHPRSAHSTRVCARLTTPRQARRGPIALCLHRRRQFSDRGAQLLLEAVHRRVGLVVGVEALPPILFARAVFGGV